MGLVSRGFYNPQINKSTNQAISKSANQHIDNLTIQKSVLFTARDEGIREGIKQGMKQGKKQGKKEGVKEGKKQGLKEGLLLVARKMLQAGEPVEKIAAITGLSNKEIENN